MDDEKDSDSEFVFDDDPLLKWSDVARPVGTQEHTRLTRQTSKSNTTIIKTYVVSSSFSTHPHLIDDEKEAGSKETEEEDVERYEEEDNEEDDDIVGFDDD